MDLLELILQRQNTLEPHTVYDFVSVIVECNVGMGNGEYPKKKSFRLESLTNRIRYLCTS